MSGETKTVYKSLGLCGFGLGSNSAAVDVKDGKIIRIRPLHYDEKYNIEDMRPWKITARNGAVLEPKTHTCPSPLQYGYKKRVYSKTVSYTHLYTVNELPCKANAGHVLAKGIKVTVSKNGSCVNLGTIDNKPIRIDTTATDKADGDHEAWASEQVTIVDEVAYENLIPDEHYKIQGSLMDKKTGEAVFVEGKEIMAEIEFVPEAPSGTVEVTFTFDGTGLGGHETVAFESLYRQFEGENLLVAEHADWESESQTVSLKEPETPSRDTVLGKGQAYDKTGVSLELSLIHI